MLRKIKLALLTAASAALLVTGLAAPVMAADKIQSGVCEGANLTLGTDSACDPNSVEGKQAEEDTKKKVNDTLELVINVLTAVVGVTAVIMIIIGGFKYITSSGDASNISGAKNTILYAIIGLVVVSLAQIIVRFVLTRVTN